MLLCLLSSWHVFRFGCPNTSTSSNSLYDTNSALSPEDTDMGNIGRRKANSDDDANSDTFPSAQQAQEQHLYQSQYESSSHEGGDLYE
mmetsp:Transcript_41761/g.42585  ORF Transcript_41761/g.42585 Transcript_41761/m.42585 type:complete len:88 (+) Transcript_41761:119-382(+)